MSCVIGSLIKTLQQSSEYEPCNFKFLKGTLCWQIKKSEDELKKGFLEKRSYALPKARKVGDEVKMVTIMLFGNAKECDIATRMIDEAVENREQKQKQREREYERKRDAKSRDRQMYHLRHTRDYETLEIPIGELVRQILQDLCCT